MTSPAAGARPDDDRRTGSTTPADGAPRRPRRRRGGRGRSTTNPSQAASGVPAADAAASPGGATPDSAAPGGAVVDPAGGAAPSVRADVARVDVPALREAKELHIRKAELAHAGGAAEEIRAIWGRLNELEQQNREPFPLSEADYAALRAQLRDRIMGLYEGEIAAQTAILDAIS